MPPKKAKTGGKSKSKTSRKCHFHKRGYCRNQEECDKEHSDKVCEDPNCDEENCKDRHPNPCKFGIRCTHNKKDECLYICMILLLLLIKI